MAQGLPKVGIVFKNIAELTARQRSYGISALILVDSSVTELTYNKIDDVTRVPSTLSSTNKDYIEQALKGLPETLKVVVLPVPGELETLDITPALNYFEMTKFNVIAAPGQGSTVQTAISEWIKTMRSDRGKKILGVVSDVAGDHEGVINLTTTDIQTKDNIYTASEYTARVSGLIAGLRLDIAPTYQVLKEIVSLPVISREVLSNRIDAGELVIFHDGEKAKLGRGVTSLTTLGDKSAGWKKIKLVRIYDRVHSDVFTTIEDEYIGKFGNSYPNKILLVEAINSYLKVLEDGGLLHPGVNECDIDVEAQKTYLLQTGYVTDDGRTPPQMDEQEIREAKTDDRVFLKIKAMALDAMEDVDINVYV